MISFRAMRRLEQDHRETVKSTEGALDWEDVFSSPRAETVGSDAALKLSAFYRAVDLRSDSIGKLPVTVKDLRTKEERPDHYLGRVLWERPNEAMSPFVYKKLLEYQRLVIGNAYAWIYRDRAGRAVELLPLPPGSCTPWLESGSGKLWYIAQDPKSGELYRLDPTDLLHYKGFSTDGINGESLLAHAARTLRVATARDEYESSVYENGGRPSGVLYTDADLSGRRGEFTLPDGSTTSLKDIIRREWEKIHSGPGNGFRTAVLDHGLKYQPIAMSNSDAQFVENKAVSVEDIARFCGVPLHLLYTGKQSYQSNEQNSVEYVKYTLAPAVVQYEEEDSRKLLTASERAAGLWLPRNMMAELRGDSASRGAWYRAMIDLGVFSVNDVRALEDMTDVDGGNSRRASLNYVPLEDWAALSRIRAERGGSTDAE